MFQSMTQNLNPFEEELGFAVPPPPVTISGLSQHVSSAPLSATPPCRLRVRQPQHLSLRACRPSLAPSTWSPGPSQSVFLRSSAHPPRTLHTHTNTRVHVDAR